MTCAKLTTRATIIAPNGERFVGTNYVRNPQPSCPREGMPTGVGYELCKSVCDQPAHAEVNACLAAGDRARGGTLYLEGHYYACEPCKRVCEEHGVTIVIGAPPEEAA
jgi:deoxycytidylate deaminase